MASAELAVDNKSDQTPLARERQHAQDESEGRLRFVVVKNDGLDRSLISLIDMKRYSASCAPSTVGPRCLSTGRSRRRTRGTA